MNWKRGLGIGFIFIGLYLIVINGVITGAVIGVGVGSTLGYIGVLVFVVGVFLVFVSKRQEFPIPKGLEDIVEVVGHQTSIRNPLYSQFQEIDEVILDTNPLITIAQRYEKDKTILSKIFDNDKYRILIPGQVRNELRGLTIPKEKGGRAGFSRNIFNYLESRLRKGIFDLEQDFKLDDKQEDYLREKWTQFGYKGGLKLIRNRGSNFEKDLINVADGKIALNALYEARKGKKVFVFTDDKILKGVLGEINEDLRNRNHPEILYGGLSDWDKYYKGYKASA